MKMPRIAILSAIAVLGLAASLSFEQKAQAQYTTETLALGSNYNNFGYTLDGNSYGGGGPIGPSSLGGRALSFVYCIDIPDEVGVPATYTNNSVTTTGKAVYGNSTINTWASGTSLVGVPNADKIAYLLTNYANGANTAVKQDALQSAIWTEIYGNRFQITAGQTAIIAQAAIYLTNVGSGDVSKFLWNSPNGVGNTPIYQALVAGVPEPSTFAIAALSGAGLVFYGRRRRLTQSA